METYFLFGEEEEKALKAQEKEDKRILEEKGFFAVRW